MAAQCILWFTSLCCRGWLWGGGGGFCVLMDRPVIRRRREGCRREVKMGFIELQVGLGGGRFAQGEVGFFKEELNPNSACYKHELCLLYSFILDSSLYRCNPLHLFRFRLKPFLKPWFDTVEVIFKTKWDSCKWFIFPLFPSS